jgi:hypothetical protein
MPNIDDRKPFWLMKKFWMAIVAALVPIVNYYMGLGLDPEAVALIIIPLIAFIFGEAWTDAAHAVDRYYFLNGDDIFEDEEEEK